jgi:hypothetical protein
VPEVQNFEPLHVDVLNSWTEYLFFGLSIDTVSSGDFIAANVRVILLGNVALTENRVEKLNDGFRL